MNPSTEISYSPTHLPSPPNDPRHPFNKVWRGSADGSVRLQGIPQFDDPYAERKWIKAHMAAVFRFWGKMGYGSGVEGCITIRDPVLHGHHWINPIGVHFSSMTTSKLVLVDPEGNISPHGAQLPINAAGYFMHSAIHTARPTISAVAHCCPSHGTAYSVFGVPVDTTTQDACALYDNHTVVHDRENIVWELGPKFRTAVIRNWGLLALGSTVDEAAHLLTRLDKQCYVQLRGIRDGTVISKQDAEFSARVIQNAHNLYLSFQPEYELIVEETGGAFLR
ncbi:Meiotically up-regulated gene 14 protein [Hypsizygus marmoreus]|uniref:Meiotically up-regulated gene 14 protein n=1 Tax=Hypsizygus marmoreus TaxID=39966 RepID=A0A369JFM4_HYPMA|nr:Meiotically up-regulated gene 14 protein [Hypsizygus marmoreus]